jgi:phosphopantetheinyl transferase (holo-ACP synthase)
MQARHLRAHLSLSDESDTALAFVVVATEDQP